MGVLSFPEQTFHMEIKKKSKTFTNINVLTLYPSLNIELANKKVNSFVQKKPLQICNINKNVNLNSGQYQPP